MFSDCTSLTTAPALPATTLVEGCYKGMFSNAGFTSAPVLPATTLAKSCYESMFQNCMSLTTAPTLPETVLVERCYAYMFNGCKSLTTAPVLPATTLPDYCYYQMFGNCTNLSTITLGYTGNFADAPSNTFFYWVTSVAASGTFYYNGSDTTRGVSAIPSGWTITPFTP